MRETRLPPEDNINMTTSNHPDLPTFLMWRDMFMPWAHDRGRQMGFIEAPGADPAWHPLADRDIEGELIALTGKTLIEAEFDLIEAWHAHPPRWMPPEQRQPGPPTATNPNGLFKASD